MRPRSMATSRRTGSPRHLTAPHTLEGVLQKRLVVCVGAGGVGKTTIAAALALAGALGGRAAAVITVDPARRLKDALGLQHLSLEPHTVRIGPSRSFDALALDTKETFDALIRRFAPNTDVRRRILQNRLYQELSSELAGAAEYMAMEKLHELVHTYRYDLLVVDTPPSAHIRDLLAAPARLTDLLASRALGLLKAPGTLLAGATSTMGRLALATLLQVLQRWTGLDLLQDLADFVSGFEHMTEGFSTRAAEIRRLLHAPTTALVLVTTPDPQTVETTVNLYRELIDGGFPVAGIVANRVLVFHPVRDGDRAFSAWPASLRPDLRRAYGDLCALSQRDHRTLRRLQEETGAPLLATVPARTESPTSLAGLHRFARALVPGPARD